MAKDIKKETPLMKQYRDIKSKYPDSVLLFRVGDFYETFHDDAIIASKVLGIILTKRGAGSSSETKLAGFPYHSLDTYLHKLVKAGYRVAICEQLENPKLTKKIVKRGVTDLITPGVALNDEILSQKTNNFLAAININKSIFGVSFLDISTGEFLVSEGSEEYIVNLIQNFGSKEILITKEDSLKLQNKNINHDYFYFVDEWLVNLDTSLKKIKNHFSVTTTKGFGISNKNSGLISASMILHYLEESHKKDLSHIKKLSLINEQSCLQMDRFTLSNLEILNSKFSEGKSLLDIIDNTITPMGARLLRRWLCFPSIDIKEINIRNEIVSEIMKSYINDQDFIYDFKSIIDIERVVSKIGNLKVNPRELLNLKLSLEKVLLIKKALSKSTNKFLKNISTDLTNNSPVIKILGSYLNDEVPVNISKGGVIRKGINKDLDKYRDLLNNGKNYLNRILEREIKNTQIPSLKINFNNVFGYYLEVTNVHKDKVPESWIRKQTLVNAERYITEELKEYESKILHAEENIAVLENKEFNKLIKKIIPDILGIQNNAAKVAYLDCLISFAETATLNDYTKPEVNKSYDFEVYDSRHPVIEHSLEETKSYIPNDIKLNRDNQQILMITGPNMSGKSAILRQTAIITILAQIGSFVPASKLKMGFVDKIFTRVGASDNISQGESTFMVEMLEAASIVNNISDRSLVLLDEIGRGTSTYDGISIAWGITQFLHENIHKPKTLFATHYHELNMMTESFKRIKNYNVQVKETSSDVIFLRKLIQGGSAHSFGIHVAKMAGMPEKIINISKNVLKKLEKSHQSSSKIEVENDSDMQLSFFSLDDNNFKDFKKELESLDTDNLTPVEALVKLSELKKKITDND